MIRQPPMAAQNILVVLNKRNARVGELTRLIERDPALVHSLLRHANSAWYATGGSQPVVTVRGAIQRIGTNGVHATVMSSIMKGQLSRPGTEYSRMAHVAWEHMVRVAPLVRLLATPFGMDPEEVYTLGLLHDVGKLAFFDRIADLRRRKRRAVRLSSGFLEDALAILHEPLGGLACLQWGLSGEFAEAVASHHRSPPPEMGGHPTEVLYLAERLDLAWKQGRVADVDALWEEGGLTTPKEQVLPLLPEAAAPYGDVLAARVRAQVALPPEGRFMEVARQVMA
ncbi:MAG: HDOD domain-containing protein [Gemmatimonadota bacterium]